MYNIFGEIGISIRIYEHDKNIKDKIYKNVKLYIYIYFKIKYVEIWKNNEFYIQNRELFPISRLIKKSFPVCEKISKLISTVVLRLIISTNNRSKSRGIKGTEFRDLRQDKGRRKGDRTLWDGNISPLPKR